MVLFLQAYKDVPFHPWLRGSLEGVSARHCNSLMSARDRISPRPVQKNGSVRNCL